MTDFGLHVEAPGQFALYKNGSFVSRHSTSAWSGGNLTISSHSNASLKVPHVDRIEVRTGPGSTLLFADDFVSLAGWSVSYEATSGVWSISPASHVSYAGFGGSITRAMPVGGVFVELLGVSFDVMSSDPGFVMVTLNDPTPTLRTDFISPDPNDGYRAYLSADPSLPVLTGSPVFVPPAGAGWAIGGVRIA